MGRVLIIEDRPAIADGLRRKLATDGWKVTSVSNGADGERRALADGVSLVVVDQMESERLELIMAVRRREPALPIIVVSSRAEVANRIAALDAGANDFLAKPFSVDELVARVRAHLRRAAWT